MKASPLPAGCRPDCGYALSLMLHASRSRFAGDVGERMAAPSARARAGNRPQSSRAFARNFVYVFAVAPALVAIAIAFASGRLGPLDRIAPLVVLSGLAVIVAAGDKVLLYRERLVSSAWFGLLVVPAAAGRARDCDSPVDIRDRSSNRAACQCGRAVSMRIFISAAPASRSLI